eukprot:8235358-Karenia_brevis.AAC.1
MEETIHNYQHDIDQMEEQEKIMEQQRSQLATSTAQPTQQPTPPSQHPTVSVSPTDIHNVFSSMFDQMFSPNADLTQ